MDVTASPTAVAPLVGEAAPSVGQKPSVGQRPLRVHVLLLHTEDRPMYRTALEETWLATRPSHWDYHFVVGGLDGGPVTVVEEDGGHVLRVHGVPDDGLHAALPKTVAAWRWLCDHRADWDVTVRTNNGTYMVPDRLDRWCRDGTLPRERLAAGTLGDFNGQPFLSGCCMVLSRDLVHTLLTDVPLPLPVVPHDDVILSMWLQRRHHVTRWYSLPRGDWDGTHAQFTVSDTAWAYRLSVPYDPCWRVRKLRALHRYFLARPNKP